MSLPRFFALVSAVLLAASAAAPVARAQTGAPSRWVELALPSGFTNQTIVRTLGSSGWFQTPTDVYLWSGVTLNWVAVPVTASAVVTQYNDYITIEDGNVVHGFATVRGVVDTLTLPSAPTVYHGSPSSNWVSIAVSGTDAWSFGAFDGFWRHTTLAGTTITTSITSTIALLSDGVNVYGVSAYFGDMVQAPAVPGGTLNNGGDLGILVSPTKLAGFSVNTNRWEFTTTTNAAPIAIDRGYALFLDGAEFVAYSSSTGDFARATAPATYTFQPGRYVAAFKSGNDVVAYGSGQNVFRTKSFTSTPTVFVDDEVVAVATTTGVTAFSVVTGEFSSTVSGGFAVTTNDAMVWADGGTVGWAYAAIRGTWVQAPVPLGVHQVSVLRNGVVLSGPQAYEGFSGRTGTWVSRPCTVPFVYTGPNSGDMFVAFDGTQAHAFDPVLVRWTTTSIAGTPLMQDVWRRVFVAFDGTSGLGYSLSNNEWSTVPVQGTFRTLDANSECGYLLTSTHLYTYAGLGSLSTNTRFPEFSRVQPFHEPLRVFQVAPPGSRVYALLARGAAVRTLPNLGTLYLDMTRALGRRDLGVVPASGVLDVRIDVTPFHSAFRSAVHVQTYVVPPVGSPWLSNAIAPVML